MKNFLDFILLAVVTVGICCIGAGCGSVMKSATESASAKNLDAAGYIMVGEIETNNPETGTPQGRLVVGRLTYKSRKVGIPADQKVPTTGNFRYTKTKSLFGTEEEIMEYDFTAGSDADAKAALEIFEAKRKEAWERNQKESSVPVQSAESTPVQTSADAK